MTKLKLMGKGHSDELYTPEYAFNMLLPFLQKDKRLFECAEGTGQLKKIMQDSGYSVISSKDFFNDDVTDFDIIVSNPPYSIKDKFLEKCYTLRKPFALLMPINALEGIKRQELYRKYGIQILLPNKRIDFNGKGSPWFYTAWFCWNLLPKDIMFVNKQSNQKLLENI